MGPYNFVDLFCGGGGGLSVGLELAGFKPIYANDVCINSINTIRANHKNTVATCEPIEFLTEQKIKKYVKNNPIHLVAGGPPCQGFSTIGKGNPSDQKNNLFQHFVRIVDILQPAFVLFENVTGLVANKNGHILESIIRSFESIGYTLHIQILESQKYGVPQKRKRTFIVGAKDGRAFNFPTPEFDTTINQLYIPPKTVGGSLFELEDYLDSLGLEDPMHNLKDAIIKKNIDAQRLMCIPEGRYIRYKKDEDKYLPPNLKLNIDWASLREGRLRENHYFRLSRKKPAPTINTENHYYHHPTEHRRFTLRELAMFQSFPVNYLFMGRKVAIKRLIGNAVPPLMARAIGKEIFLSLRYRKTDNSRVNINIKDVRSSAFTYDGMAALSEYNQKRRINANQNQKKLQ